MNRAERIYRILLKLYPQSHRKAHAQALLGCFLDLYCDTVSKRSLACRTLFWARTLLDTFWNASLLRFRGRRRTAKPNPGERPMAALGQDLAHAWRRLWRTPALTALAVGTLALGIGANTAIFSALELVFLRPLPYRQPQRLVIVWPETWFSHSEFDFYRQGFQSLQGLSALQPQSVTLTGPEEPERLDGLGVSAAIFPLLGVQPVQGRPFSQAEDRPGGGDVAVISYGLWQRRFGGDAAAVGRSATFNGRPHRIVGVLPAGFYLPLEADVWLPLQIDPTQRDYENTYQLKIVARLGEGAALQQAGRKLQALARQRRKQRPDLHSEEYGEGAQVRPLRSALLSDFQTPILFLQAAVAFVLLMACVNIGGCLRFS